MAIVNDFEFLMEQLYLCGTFKCDQKILFFPNLKRIILACVKICTGRKETLQ